MTLFVPPNTLEPNGYNNFPDPVFPKPICGVAPTDRKILDSQCTYHIIHLNTRSIKSTAPPSAEATRAYQYGADHAPQAVKALFTLSTLALAPYRTLIGLTAPVKHFPSTSFYSTHIGAAVGAGIAINKTSGAILPSALAIAAVSASPLVALTVINAFVGDSPTGPAIASGALAVIAGTASVLGSGMLRAASTITVDNPLTRTSIIPSAIGLAILATSPLAISSGTSMIVNCTAVLGAGFLGEKIGSLRPVRALCGYGYQALSFLGSHCCSRKQ